MRLFLLSVLPLILTSALNIPVIQPQKLPVYNPSDLFTNKNYLTGNIHYEDYPDFVKIDKGFTTQENAWLRKDAYESFLNMHRAAKKDGVQLLIVSAARTFDRQKKIWEDKWEGRRPVEGKNLAESVSDSVERARLILLYSSMPMTSRHHWGTDIDINNLEDSYFLNGKGKKEYEWLCKNAHRYGFCQVYSAKGSSRPYGYEEEKWHWSYLPVSATLLSEYTNRVSLTDIRGFKGSGTAISLCVIERYVRGISPSCSH